MKPAVLGIIAAGIIKLGRAAIGNIFLAILLVAIFVAAFLLILWAKLDVALVAIFAIVGGVLYSLTGFI